MIFYGKKNEYYDQHQGHVCQETIYARLDKIDSFHKYWDLLYYFRISIITRIILDISIYHSGYLPNLPPSSGPRVIAKKPATRQKNDSPFHSAFSTCRRLLTLWHFWLGHTFSPFSLFFSSFQNIRLFFHTPALTTSPPSPPKAPIFFIATTALIISRSERLPPVSVHPPARPWPLRS